MSGFDLPSPEKRRNSRRISQLRLYLILHKSQDHSQHQSHKIRRRHTHLRLREVPRQLLQTPRRSQRRRRSYLSQLATAVPTRQPRLALRRAALESVHLPVVRVSAPPVLLCLSPTSLLATRPAARVLPLLDPTIGPEQLPAFAASLLSRLAHVATNRSTVARNPERATDSTPRGRIRWVGQFCRALGSRRVCSWRADPE